MAGQGGPESGRFDLSDLSAALSSFSASDSMSLLDLDSQQMGWFHQYFLFCLWPMCKQLDAAVERVGSTRTLLISHYWYAPTSKRDQ